MAGQIVQVEANEDHYMVTIRVEKPKTEKRVKRVIDPDNGQVLREASVTVEIGAYQPSQICGVAGHICRLHEMAETRRESPPGTALAPELSPLQIV